VWGSREHIENELQRPQRRITTMKRLPFNPRFAMTLGVVLWLQAMHANPCRAQGLCWWCFHGSAPTAVTTTMTTATAPTTAVVPPTPPPGAAPGVGAAPGYSAAPAYYAASSYSAAPAYYAAPNYYSASNYYAASGYSYYPTSSAAAAPAAAPVGSASYLASFVPDGQAAPAAGPFGLVDRYSSQNRGQAILNGLRSTFAGNRGMLFGTLLQTALQLFTQQFGLSPNNQDYGILTDLVQKVISEATGSAVGSGGGVNTGTSEVPQVTVAPTTGTSAQGSVMTISVEALGPDGKLQVVSRVTVNLGGATAGSHGNTAPVAPGGATNQPNSGVVPPTPPPAGAAPPAEKAGPKA
jgi:hypothetical protein